MPKARILSKLVYAVAWLTGLIVSLAVGFGMAQGTLTIPWLTSLNAGIIAVVAGWVVVVLTALGAILAIIDRF